MTIPNRDMTPVKVSPAPPWADEALMITIMTEAFLNQQLGETLLADGMAVPARLPFQIQMTGAALDLHPERRATITVAIVVVAGPLRVPLRPVAALEFLPQVGRVRISVTKIQLQGVTIPRAWVDRFLNEIVANAETQMNSTLQHIQSDTHVELFDLETTESTLVLKFRGL